jgi:hypothetical protein
MCAVEVGGESHPHPGPSASRGREQIISAYAAGSSFRRAASLRHLGGRRGPGMNGSKKPGQVTLQTACQDVKGTVRQRDFALW